MYRIIAQLSQNSEHVLLQSENFFASLTETYAIFGFLTERSRYCQVISMLTQLPVHRRGLVSLHEYSYWPSTHGVEGQTSNGRWHLSSSVGVCNTRICNVTHQRVAHGGPVVLRPVRATPCLYVY